MEIYLYSKSFRMYCWIFLFLVSLRVTAEVQGIVQSIMTEPAAVVFQKQFVESDAVVLGRLEKSKLISFENKKIKHAKKSKSIVGLEVYQLQISINSSWRKNNSITIPEVLNVNVATMRSDDLHFISKLTDQKPVLLFLQKNNKNQLVLNHQILDLYLAVEDEHFNSLQTTFYPAYFSDDEFQSREKIALSTLYSLTKETGIWQTHQDSEEKTKAKVMLRNIASKSEHVPLQHQLLQTFKPWKNIATLAPVATSNSDLLNVSQSMKAAPEAEIKKPDFTNSIYTLLTLLVVLFIISHFFVRYTNHDEEF